MGTSIAIIADPKNGKTYKKEVSQENLNSLSGRKAGDEIDGIFFDLPGYKLKITGGTTNDGFPIRSDLQTSGRKRILVSYTKGKKGKNGYRKRITLRGAIIGPDISQLNLKVLQYGPAPLEPPAESAENSENKEEEKKE
ncbi:MAG: 30S ribosomal protein S6e [Thermoplasmatales archaeon]|nr:30S ribosomal protein S6e [Thermoplasmatales archaeon]MCW6170589.1 30S ribosomal protein S6e [Thermoplasmatales archaeon]